MKTLSVLFAVMLCLAAAYAQDDYNQTERKIEVPEGMTVYRIGNNNLILPKGTRLTFKPGLIIVEDTAQYTARNTQEMNKRIDRLQQRIAELEKRLGIPAENPAAR